MPILYRTAKEILARYVGTGGVCVDNPQVDRFVREVLEYLLNNGQYGNEHKFTFCSARGNITVPKELETPLKVRIDERVGDVWDRWFEYHPTKYLDNCVPAGRALQEDPNYYATVYDIPAGGRRIGILGTCAESAEAHIVIKGVDPTGREIITNHKGVQVVGEHLDIKYGQITYSQATFAQITQATKTETVGYTTLYWIGLADNKKGFLADYTPLETTPQYRRFRLTSPQCQQGSHKVEVIGRIRLKDKYADNDLIPFDNILALNLAGQAVNGVANKDIQAAAANDQMLGSIIERENESKKITNGQPMEVYPHTAGGSIRNIVGGYRGRGGFR